MMENKSEQDVYMPWHPKCGAYHSLKAPCSICDFRSCTVCRVHIEVDREGMAKDARRMAGRAKNYGEDLEEYLDSNEYSIEEILGFSAKLKEVNRFRREAGKFYLELEKEIRRLSLSPQ